MRTVRLPTGEQVSAYGMGTWQIGDNAASRAEEIATLRLGLDLGVRVIDTAEMYGEGRSEELVGEAIAGRRDDAFLVSKVYPHNASRRGCIAACERSLRRLGVDRIDLYLLHWRGEVPLAETMEAFRTLQDAGKIGHYGVSNFDLKDMQELWKTNGGPAVATNQVLYNLQRRGIEWDLLPWMRKRQLPLMAYSPIEQAKLVRNRQLVDFARRYEITAAQAALAWLLSKDDVLVIPKTSRRDRLQENLGALDVRLTAEQLVELNRQFPPPSGPQPLEMI